MVRRYLIVLAAICAFASAAWAVTTCTITGTLQNPDTTPCANCTIQFNSLVTQVVNGSSIAPLIVTTSTNSSGVLNSITINQGLAVQVTITEAGQTFAPFGAIIPNQSAATFSNLAQGVSTNPLNILASLQPATGPVTFNNQKATNLAAPSVNGDALVWGDNAVVNNLTVAGSFSQTLSGSNFFGLLSVSQISTPGAPTVTAVGSTGSTTYYYFIVCHDGNSGNTLPSSSGSVTNSNATLSVSNYNSVSFTVPSHSSTCDVIRNTINTVAGAQLCTNGTVSITPANAGVPQVFLDQSNTTSAYVVPSRNSTGDGQFAGQVQAATLNITGGISGNAFFGLLPISQVSTPSAPTIATVGTTGATTYYYFVVCHDGNGGTTVASASGNLTSSNATLSTSNYNLVTFVVPTHAANCDILRNTSNTTTGAQSCTGGLAITFSPFADQSNTTAAYSIPARNTTGDILDVGVIVAGTTSTTILGGGPVNGDIVSGDGTGSGRVWFGTSQTPTQHFLDYGTTNSGQYTLANGGLTVATGNLTLSSGGVTSNGVTIAAANLLQLGSTVFASLPASCTAGAEVYCSDCKSVADAITMASTCVNSGNGSVAVCKAANAWKCGQ